MADESVVKTPDAPTEPTTTSEAAPVAPETTPTTEPTAEGTPAAPSDEPKQTRFQRRIDQMTRKIHDLERQLVTTRQPEPTQPATPDHEPQEGEFADYGQYLKALAKYEIRQQQAVIERETATRQQQTRMAELSQQFEPQLTAARAKYEDFDEVVAQPLFSPATHEMLLHSSHGADIAYFLGTNPHEAMKLNQLPPVALAREIVKLEARFAVQPKTVSQAPAPITPVTGGTPAIKDPDNMTTEEWMAWDKQQRMERLKAKPF